MDLAPSEGQTMIVLIDGKVHLQHVQRSDRTLLVTTLCGSLLGGCEQRSKLDQADVAYLNTFNVCPHCLREYERTGQIGAALGLLTQSAILSEGNRVLPGQLPLFEA
jgi:hypothetical protein